MSGLKIYKVSVSLSKCLYQELCIGPTSNSSHILLHQSKIVEEKVRILYMNDI